MRKHKEATVEDENQAAARILAVASGVEKNPHAVAMAKARAAKLSTERRQEIATGAARVRWKGHKKK